MVQIKPFEVEQWMDRLEGTPGVLNLAETCAASVSIDELVSLSADPTAAGPLDLSRKLTYGAVRGSNFLRERIAALVGKGGSTPFPAENVVIAPGAIMANFLLFYTLVGPGDHVVCVYPTYQQLYDVPASLGAEVSLWKLKRENNYILDVADLETLVKDNTKLIVINNPNNPTGATTPHSILAKVVDFAKARGIYILSDEVYSPLFHSLPAGEEAPPSIVTFGYEKGIATGSMSKAFALAGIRLGWIAASDKSVTEAVVAARDYSTISVSQLDDQIAGYALSEAVLPGLLKRNTELAQKNLALLDSFVQKYSSVVTWVKPTAGTTAFIQFKKNGEPVDDPSFVLDVLDQTKALVMPGGTCFGADFKGFVRFGYACHTNVLEEGLRKFGGYIEKNLLSG